MVAEASGVMVSLVRSVDQGREEGVLDVERWAELRREHSVRDVPIKELVRRTGLSRNTHDRQTSSRQTASIAPLWAGSLVANPVASGVRG